MRSRPIFGARDVQVQSKITLEHLEGMTVAFLDFAESLDWDLLSGECREFRFISMGYDLVRIKHQFKKLPKEKQTHHDDLKGKLRALIFQPVPAVGLDDYLNCVCPTAAIRDATRMWLLERIELHMRPKIKDGKTIPGLSEGEATQKAIADFGRPKRHDQPSRDDFRLDELEIISRRFVRLCEKVRRPLLPSAKGRFAWILRAWDNPTVKSELLLVHEDRLGRDDELVRQLHVWLDPIADQRPYRPISERLWHLNAVAVAERTEKNYAWKRAPGKGAQMRCLGHNDIAERFDLAAHLVTSLRWIIWEIALASPTDREASKPLIALLDHVVLEVQTFSDKSEALSRKTFAALAVNQETGRREYIDWNGNWHRTLDTLKLLCWNDARKLAAKWEGDLVDTRQPSDEEKQDIDELLAELKSCS